jgi:uncharacterized protein
MANQNQGGGRGGNNRGGQSGNSRKGFASMDPEEQREIAREGGKASGESRREESNSGGSRGNRGNGGNGGNRGGR